MAIKLTFLLLGMMLVASTLHAAPAPVPDYSNEKINLDIFVERLKIALLAVKEFKDLYSEIMRLGPKIVQDLLNDPEVKAVDNDTMEKVAKKLSDYLEKYEASTPVPNYSSEEINLNIFFERLKIALLTVQDFKDLYNEIMTLGPKMIKNVLDDPEVKAVDNDAMKELTKKLSDYLEKYEALKESDRKAQVFELVEEYDDLITNFDSKQHPYLSPEEAIIQKSLDRNGLEVIQKTIGTRLKNFLKKFETEVDDYLSKLNEKEKKYDHEFIEWYEKLKNEKDVDKKLFLFL